MEFETNKLSYNAAQQIHLVGKMFVGISVAYANFFEKILPFN